MTARRGHTLTAARIADRTVLHTRVAGPPVGIRWSSRADGDFHRTEVPLTELERRRRTFVDLPWTMLDEHHGTTVVRIDRPGAYDGSPGDIAVTSCTGAVLGCWVGDCAPVILVGRGREVAAVHAGWRGLAGGVLDVAFDAMSEPVISAFLGPAIGPCCYEFGTDDLRAVAAGSCTDVASIAGHTSWGTRALDVPATVAAVCARRGVALDRLRACTGCSFDGFSHRVRAERQRHVVAVWQGSAR